MREEDLYLAGLTESYSPRRYRPKGPDGDYYVDNPAPAHNAGFNHNFSALVGTA